MRERYSEEWLQVVDDIAGPLLKLWTALGFTVAAGPLVRERVDKASMRETGFGRPRFLGPIVGDYDAPQAAPTWQFLSERKTSPTAEGQLELLRVGINGELLTIATVKGQCRKRNGPPVESLGPRLYALKTVTMQDATAFMFLSEPPAGVSDDKFFPAKGTAVLYDNSLSGSRVLKACGIDRNNGQCLSWIIHAVET